jgi:acyl-CoA oxidase
MDTKELGAALLQLDDKKRDDYFKLLSDPVFVPKYTYKDWDETRDHPYQKLKKVTESKIVSIRDFETNPHNIFAAHEFLAMACSSLVIKFTVQFNLFGGSIFALCTDRHKHLFDKIDDLSVCGCFCLTELGYGNNAVKMETTATYDEAKKEFEVHSPSVLSQKYWISNGYKHANHSLVFAQTIVKGKNEGVNAFLVPTRDIKTHQPIAGITINDMGHKLGANGVDNAALKYNKVRIPREFMMNRYADVTPEGQFNSEVKKIPQRFFKVTERLLSGRICIAAMCVGAQKACLMIAVRYAQQRLSIGVSGKSTEPIMSY